MSPERQISLDAVLERGDAALVEAHRLEDGERFMGEVGERLATPLGQRRADAGGRPLGVPRSERGAALFAELFEPLEVELARFQPERVAGRSTHDSGALGAESTAQAR